MKYPKAYGGWSGNPKGTSPDFGKCAASFSSRFFDSHQCPYTAMFDPDENGKPTACGKHRDKAKAAAEQPDVPVEVSSTPFTMHEASAACPLDGCGFVTRKQSSVLEDAGRRAFSKISFHLRHKHKRNTARVGVESQRATATRQA